MLWVFAVALLVRMALNTLDGMMARIHDMASVSGEILNELGDVLSDAMMYLPLIKLAGVNPWWVVSFVFLSLLNEFVGVLTKAATGTRRYDGPMGKSDRAVVLGLACLLSFLWPGAMVSFDYIFAVMSLLLVASSAVRIKNALALTGDQS